MQLGFITTLFLVFLALKLTHFITWSWLWVTAPLWVGLIITLFIFVVGVACVIFLAGDD